MYSVVEIESLIEDRTYPKRMASLKDLENLSKTLYTNFNDKKIMLSLTSDKLYQKLHALTYFVYPSSMKYDAFEVSLDRTF